MYILYIGLKSVYLKSSVCLSANHLIQKQLSSIHIICDAWPVTSHAWHHWPWSTHGWTLLRRHADMQSLLQPSMTFVQWPLSQPATTMWDTFLSFFTRKYQSYNITMLLCFKLDASTQVDIFTKVIKNTKKKLLHKTCYTS